MPAPCNSVTLHGHELSYLDVGAGPAVVFVHGLMSSSATWTAQLDRLGDRPSGHRARPVRARRIGEAGRRLLAQRTCRKPARSARRLEVAQRHRGRPFPRRRHCPAIGLPVPGAGRRPGAGQQRRARPGAESVAARRHPARQRTGASGGRLGLGARRRRHGAAAGGPRSACRRSAPVRTRVAGSVRAWPTPIPGGRSWPPADPSSMSTGRRSARKSVVRHRVPPVDADLGRAGPDDPGRPCRGRAKQELPASRVEMFPRSGHFPHLDEPDRFARVLAEFMTLRVGNDPAAVPLHPGPGKQQRQRRTRQDRSPR